MEPVRLSIEEHGLISDIDVYLNITHSEVSDLWIFLDEPRGGTVFLKDDELFRSLWPGIKRPNMYATIFDDSAELELSEGVPPYTGRFKPAKGYSLSEFNGGDVYGDWTLRIYDLAWADTGTLDRWELHIEFSPVPEPAGIFYLALPGLLGWGRIRSRFR